MNQMTKMRHSCLLHIVGVLSIAMYVTRTVNDEP